MTIADRDVVITGVGAVTPLGNGAPQLLRRWCDQEVGIRDGLGRCDEFQPTQVLSRKEARRTDRFAQLSLAAAEEALEQAGWDGTPPYDPFRVACVIGTGIGGMATIEDELDGFRGDGPTAVSPLTVPRMMGNAAAAAVALRYGLRGPSAAAVSACAAGAEAAAAGLELIRAGAVDAAVVGGAESAVSDFVRSAFSAMGATSASGVSRPFDARRDGFVLSEGAATLVLEESGHARRRGARVLGRILGAGRTSDAVHLTAPDPAGCSAREAIARALDDAGVGPASLDYVNAHGTGTPLNDRAETSALKSALGPHASATPVTSVKSVIGHALGAAGAIEAVVTLLALRDRVAPPTVGWEIPEDGLDLDYAGDGPRPLRRDGDGPIGLSTSFGFGGHNVVLVLQAAAR